jgi:uncharacterized protein YecT (DUF1311 family)
MIKFLPLVLVGFWLTGCTSAKSYRADSTLMIDWHPAIIGYNWDDSYWNAADGQQNLNYKSGEWSAILEAKLYVIFNELMAQSAEKERVKLASEQEKWLKETLRDAMEAGKQFEGGTAQSMAVNASFGHATQARIKILETRLIQSQPHSQSN